MGRLAVVCLLVALALPGAAWASRSQLTIFEAPRELKSADPELRAQTFDEIAAFGVDWVRVLMYWHDVAPSADAREEPAFDDADPAAYPASGWAPYDRAIREARARGMQVLLTVSGPVPRWATRGARDTVTRPSPERFRRFMTAVARRYGDDVDTWSIWNEPNHPQFLGPQFERGRAASPGIYRRLFRAGRQGLADAGNGGDRVLMGETSPRGNSKTVSPVTMLREALCLDSRWRRRRGCGALAGVDGWAHHPYTSRLGPRFVPRQRGDVTIGALSRLTRGLDRAARAGAVPRHLPLWLTEFGVQSTPDPIAGVSELRQAEYRSISEWIAWRNPRVQAFSQYMMRDDLPREGPRAMRFRGFESGLRHSGGEIKIAFDGFRLPLAALRSGSRVSLWGMVRPARSVTSVVVERRDGGGSWRRLTAVQTDARGAWAARTRYRSGRSYRAVWTRPDGRRFVGPRTRVYAR
jgi:hypothetical protein